jgi:hypothetical protein
MKTKWTAKKQRDLDYCKMRRLAHYKAMMSWSRQVKIWESIKVRCKKGQP